MIPPAPKALKKLNAARSDPADARHPRKQPRRDDADESR